MRADLDALEVAAGHRLADREILRRALTHSSHVHEQALAGGQAIQKKNPAKPADAAPPANPAPPPPPPRRRQNRKPRSRRFPLCARIWTPWRSPPATGSRIARSSAANRW